MDDTTSEKMKVPDNKEPKIYGPVDVARWFGGVAVNATKWYFTHLPESGSKRLRNARIALAGGLLLIPGCVALNEVVTSDLFIPGIEVEDCLENPSQQVCKLTTYEEKKNGPNIDKKPKRSDFERVYVGPGDEPIPYVPYDPNTTTTSATGSDNFDVSYDISGGTTTSANVSGNFEIEIVLKQNNVPVIT